MDVKNIFLLTAPALLAAYSIYYFFVRAKNIFNASRKEAKFKNYPWCIEAVKRSYGKLWRVDESTFRILEKGALGDIISGHKHILVESNLVKGFENLEDQLEIKPVQIVDQQTGEEWRNYFELIIRNELTTGNIDTLETSGIRIWHYTRENIFISPELKEVLQKTYKDKFEFSLGFSQFGMTKS